MQRAWHIATMGHIDGKNDIISAKILTFVLQMKVRKKDELLGLLRQGGTLSRGDKLNLVALLSLPAMLGQLSVIAMQYIDAMMVGQLGAQASAAVGVVSTSTWLFGGVCSTLGSGFGVLVAHRIGAGDRGGARNILRQALLLCVGFALSISALCVSMHHHLPLWLGADAEVAPLASQYFLVWSLTLPVMQLMYLSHGMLRSSGNMLVPGVIGVVMCLLDVVFNSIFIPRWDVLGAALATSLAGTIAALSSLSYLLFRSRELSLWRQPGRLRFDKSIIRSSLNISAPMMLEHGVFCAAQIASTVIVAGLGTVAIAANAFGIVVESLCYMPGYGIGEAATTLIGQSYGARRGDLIRSFSRLTIGLGVAVMTLLGVVMYVFAPQLMSLMTPDVVVQTQSVIALRIEAFAEPMYAASIIVYCVFVGLGDTLVPSIINLSTIWLVRIPLAYVLSRTMGFPGVWVAMAVELTVRGTIFLIRMKLKKIDKINKL